MQGKTFFSCYDEVEKAPRGRKAKEGEEQEKLPGAGKVAGCRNFGRKRMRLQAAHRRATEDVGWRGFRFLSDFGLG